MSFSTLRNIQGLHAPLKLQMEYRAARQVRGRVSLSPIYTALLDPFTCLLVYRLFLMSLLLQIQRLPFLPSSNLAVDTLRGSDESIGFEDILNGQNLTPTVTVTQTPV